MARLRDERTPSPGSDVPPTCALRHGSLFGRARQRRFKTSAGTQPPRTYCGRITAPLKLQSRPRGSALHPQQDMGTGSISFFKLQGEEALSVCSPETLGSAHDSCFSRRLDLSKRRTRNSPAQTLTDAHCAGRLRTLRRGSSPTTFQAASITRPTPFFQTPNRTRASCGPRFLSSPPPPPHFPSLPKARRSQPYNVRLLHPGSSPCASAGIVAVRPPPSYSFPPLPAQCSATLNLIIWIRRQSGVSLGFRKASIAPLI